MFKMEIYRILSKRLVIIAMVLCVFLGFYYGMIAVSEEAVVDDGQLYRREQSHIAIAKNSEITAQFAGYLTEETVRNIWEKYGAPCRYDDGVDEDALIREMETGGSYNYCNRLVAKLFCDMEETEDGEIIFSLSENLSENRYLRGDYYFGYAGRGWTWYWDSFLVIFVLVCLVVIVALAPVFSEDYVCRTAGCILPTVRGRMCLWITRTLAGCLFASLFYWLMAGMLFVQQIFFYGTEGLRVSCGLTEVPMFWEDDAAPLWRAVLLIHFCSWFAVLVLTLLVQGISAKCRQTFSSVLWSLFLFAGPFALLRLVLDKLPMGRLNILLHRIIYSMPFSYTGITLSASPDWRRFMTGCALVMALSGGLLGARAWVAARRR